MVGHQFVVVGHGAFAQCQHWFVGGAIFQSLADDGKCVTIAPYSETGHWRKRDLAGLQLWKIFICNLKTCQVFSDKTKIARRQILIVKSAEMGW
jgi:hypothetical protein